MEILVKRIEQKFYVSSDGRETPLEQMNDSHLLNAFAKADRENNNETISPEYRKRREPIVTELRIEILRRMKGEKEDED